MIIKLIICLSFATHINADRTSDNILYFDAKELIEELTAYKIGCSDYEELGGNVLSPSVVLLISAWLINKSGLVIGRQELREALNFGPVPPIAHHNSTKPSKEELASAPTLEAYYDLIESRATSVYDNMYNLLLLDVNIPPAIAFLDKKFPAIRATFRRKIQAIIQSEGGMNRESIDRWESELSQFNLSRPILSGKTDVDC